MLPDLFEPANKGTTNLRNILNICQSARFNVIEKLNSQELRSEKLNEILQNSDVPYSEFVNFTELESYLQMNIAAPTMLPAP